MEGPYIGRPGGGGKGNASLSLGSAARVPVRLATLAVHVWFAAASVVAPFYRAASAWLCLACGSRVPRGHVPHRPASHAILPVARDCPPVQSRRSSSSAGTSRVRRTVWPYSGPRPQPLGRLRLRSFVRRG